MEINGLQIISAAFSIAMIYFAYFCYKRKFFGIYSFIVWTIVFLGLIVATLFPAIFTPFQKALQLARLFDLFTVIGFFFLITLTFINFIHLNRLRRKLGEFIQEDALKQPRHRADNDGDGEIS